MKRGSAGLERGCPAHLRTAGGGSDVLGLTAAVRAESVPGECQRLRRELRFTRRGGKRPPAPGTGARAPLSVQLNASLVPTGVRAASRAGRRLLPEQKMALPALIARRWPAYPVLAL